MKSTVAGGTEAMYQQGAVLYRQMRFDEASMLCDKVLEIQPGHAGALHVAGLIALQRGVPSRAVELIGAARTIEPQNAEMHTDYGLAQLRLQQFGAALASFDQAIALKPQFPPAHHWRGTALLVLQEYAAAVASYETAIALKHETPGGFYNLGSALLALKQYERALASFDRALARKPDHADAHSNRGLCLYELGRYEAAIESSEAALKLRPDHVGALNNRGNALHQLRHYQEAIASYERAIVIQPGNEKSHANLAHTLQELDLPDGALASYDKAIAINPGFAGAQADRADALMKFKRYDAAIDGYDRTFLLEPDRPFLAGKRYHARLQVCDWSDFESEGARLAAAAAAGLSVVPPFQGLALFGAPAVQRRTAETWVRQFPDRPALPAIPRRPAGGKIRIGYFSGDFRDHPVGILAAELFELHDRTRFEVFAFSFGGDKPDPQRNRLKRAVDRFIDVSARLDRDIALLARSLGIDVAVDLGGFTQGGNAPMFALRAAPLQIGYLGYAGTMGTDFMDYLIADPTVIPVEARQLYAEKIISLPNSFMPHDSKRAVAEPAPSRAALGLPATGFVFCCFNNCYKITPRRFDTWMRILSRVDGSVLWLSESNEWAAGNLRREASNRNIDPERLVFAKRIPSQPQHLARHRAADLFLDTLPYNAHTTAIDALWTGLPVLTLSGEAFAARVAASLLRAVGLPELIAASESEYEELAVALARDAPRLASLKHRLAMNRPSAPLFDSPRLTRDLETAYAMIHERYLRELPAEHIEVPGS